MEKFKVKVYVEKKKDFSTASGHAANGRIYELPIIPRKGDYLVLDTTMDDNHVESSRYEVYIVNIMNTGNVDAQIHVLTDE
ncbi:hypothetical protein C0213_03270 [Latilactobacillus sakei]|nr:hypothetical protein [Latilactobacillus sakei]AUX11466.1 hypothetical protein C0213_03270 [Latilactobacillus sakei]